MSDTPMTPNPNMPLELNNDELEAAIETYVTNKDVTSLNQLVGLIHHARVLTPANIDEQKRPSATFIRNQEGKIFIPLYTSKKHVPEKGNAPAILNLPYIGVNEMALRDELHCDGIVVNPFTTNLIFKKELLQKIEAVEKQQRAARAAANGQPIQLSEKEYPLFERRMFEANFLPKRLFADGRTLMDTLCERKEAYVDELFEESYKEKRMYPYLPEEFSVMPMDLSEEWLIIRLDMPERDMGMALCYRIYMAWNKQQEKARYFTIEQSKGENVLCEITDDMKHINYGAAPVEGAELQEILDRLEADRLQTS